MQASGDPSAADHLSSEAAAVIQLHLLTNASCVVCRVPSLTPQVSVWNNAVIRGDLNNIRIGHVSNVQERTVIHAARWGRLITVMDDLALWSMFHAWGSSGTQRYDGSSGDGGELLPMACFHRLYVSPCPPLPSTHCDRCLVQLC